MHFLFKFPTRSRPGVFRDTLEKWRNMLSGKHTYEFLISMDADDKTMNNSEIHGFLNGYPNLTYCYGESRTKVQAINANLNKNMQFDVCVLISDDMIPQVQGYDDIIAQQMEEHFVSKGKPIGVLHINDGRAASILNTLCIFGKAVYDQYGYIYHPSYRSLWCLSGESLVYMANQTFKPISEIVVGDAVVGTENLLERGKWRGPRKKLCTAEVTAVHSRVAEVVRLTLESGASVICTPDHLWAYYNSSHLHIGNYGEAKLNRPLVRVIKMPGEPPVDAGRDLGWLAGMYDGEGSFPGITQSLTKNPETCYELERVLKKLGFSYIIKPQVRSNWNLASPKNDTINLYYINGGRDEYIKFLAWTKPVRTHKKQVKKRMFTARYGTPDRIVQIETVDTRKVYCITTSTSNFVVEGLLSHNCDNEFHDVTYRDGWAVYCDQVLIRHAWVDATGQDALHRHNESYYQHDKLTYQSRKAQGFPLEWSDSNLPPIREQKSRDPRRRNMGNGLGRRRRRP